MRSNILIKRLLIKSKNSMSDLNKVSSPSPTTNSRNEENTQESSSLLSRIRKECLYYATSLQEGFRHVKASFVGQAKKVTAKNEKEASEADLQTAKMQVEATEAAEETKKRLEM